MTQSPFKPSPLASVRCERDGSRWVLVFVRSLSVPPAAAWNALTDPEELKAWSPYTSDRNLGATGPVTLVMIDRDSPEELRSHVSRAEPPRLLEYSWGDDALLRWELQPTDTGTQLTLHHSMEREDMVPRMAAGWHLCLDVAERFVEGRPIKPIVGKTAMNHGWEDLYRRYAEILGIPATDASGKGG